MDINPVNKLGFFERLSSMLLRKPEDREQLMELLHSAYERNLLDADALSITEGALAASEISVSDVMVPRSQMEVIDIDEDGSFLMNVQELATASAENIAAKAMVLNNQHLGMVVPVSYTHLTLPTSDLV